jgi:hypothetical protein
MDERSNAKRHAAFCSFQVDASPKVYSLESGLADTEPPKNPQQVSHDFRHVDPALSCPEKSATARS